MSRFTNAADRVAAGADHHDEARALVADMTTDEKLGCLDGDIPFWAGLVDMGGTGYGEHVWPAASVERLGIPGIAFSDGPRGCVIGHATAFPVSMARGATFDPALEERVGDAIGAELAAHGATYTGAVCMNLLRHPAWGRAQETYGEDPHHVGEMAAALTRGLQRWVLACMKHFALNSMENARFTVDVTVDQRALHEVYLPHFKRVADEGVASVMSAYNSVNGEWCGENRTLLVDILRDEWSWDGFVTSDFVFGVRDAVKSVGAGLNIEMPFRQLRATTLPAALDDGSLREEDVDARAIETVATLLRFWPVIGRPAPPRSVVLSNEHRALAREVAVRSTVLLRNDGALLPIDPSTLTRVAVVGHLAAVPNLGDGGSSDVHPPRDVIVTPLEGLRAGLPGVEVVHADTDPTVVDGAEVAVVVVGLTRADEGEYLEGATGPELMALFPPADDPIVGSAVASPDVERFRRPDDLAERFASGGDRRTLRLSPDDESLIAAVAARHDRTVVVVMGGSAVVMPWIDTVPATLMVWYPGLEGGHALADILTGRHEPGGRLPFAIPTDESHLVPFHPDATAETYDLFHGQWLLDRDGRQPAFAFGFGLGYTDLVLDGAEIETGPSGWTVHTTVRNQEPREGSTVVQVYAGLPASQWDRPARRLVGFARVDVGADASVEVAVPFGLDALAIRDGGRWIHEPGTYAIDVGLMANDPDRVELTLQV